MTDLNRAIESKFQPSNRYQVFGPIIRTLEIDGFRGLEGLRLDIEHPITAISGLNGTGKSTICQLFACGYRAPSTSTGIKRLYVMDFFPHSSLDPNPFRPDAKATFHYEADSPSSPQAVTISRANTEWSGYKRQPERQCHYVGFTVYLPKVERRDLSVYFAKEINVGADIALPPQAQEKFSTILGIPYEQVSFVPITHGKHKVELGVASRNGNRYSENHMGFGEGRLLYMLRLFESAPDKSLFVLEEPETSLHGDAQYRFAKYLLDLVHRKHHQLVISTHSPTILSALPSASRKLLVRNQATMRCYDRISATHARAILSGGYIRSLNVCVEDEFAVTLVRESVRSLAPEIQKSLNCAAVGDTDSVRNAVKLLSDLGVSAVGIRDADIGANASESLFSLPGSQPPEREVYGDAAVQAHIKDRFSLDVSAFLLLHPDLDHHEFTKTMAANLELEPEVLRYEAITAYVQANQPQLAGLMEELRKRV